MCIILQDRSKTHLTGPEGLPSVGDWAVCLTYFLLSCFSLTNCSNMQILACGKSNSQIFLSSRDERADKRNKTKSSNVKSPVFPQKKLWSLLPPLCGFHNLIEKKFKKISLFLLHAGAFLQLTRGVKISDLLDSTYVQRVCLCTW